MTASTRSWEYRLLERAYNAFESSRTARRPARPFDTDKEALEQAYVHCGRLTKSHSRTFYLASGLLPVDKRRAARALYAFCRISDDLVDCTEKNTRAGLDAWKQRALTEKPSLDDPVALAWTDTRIRYLIPVGYAKQLIEGVAYDLISKRYNTFDELVEYCYGVASTVGLMAMYIIGFKGPEAIPYAVKMGVALQINNILRDVGEDWEAGRLYLPQDELSAFGLTEEDIAAKRVDERWRAFMRFQIKRNRCLYDESLPGISMLDPDGRFAIAAAAELYRAILEDIEAYDYDVFNRRAYVSTYGKMRRLPGIWWRSHRLTGS